MKVKGHISWHQSTQLNGLFYHTKFERKQSVNVEMHVNSFFCSFSKVGRVGGTKSPKLGPLP